MSTFKLTGVMQQQTYTLPNRPDQLNVTSSPVNLYVIDLDGVGSGLNVNISTVVEGVLEAAEVNVTTITLEVTHNKLYCPVYFQVNATVVNDWATYKNLIENGGNITVVNAHNEILPVPDGYTKEAWLSEISDFLSNRWGTWVDTGGMPFSYVQYQNGTGEEWGPEGFSTFMSYIGGNETCTTPSEFKGPYDAPDCQIPGGVRLLNFDWPKFYFTLDCSIGYPMRSDDFTQGLLLVPFFEGSTQLGGYEVGASYQYKPASSSSFGDYVHFGAVQVAAPPSVSNASTDFYLGYVPTAVAIWGQVGLPISKTMSYEDGAWGNIYFALLQNRTQGLDQAFTLYDQAEQEYLQGHYLQSLSYAQQAAAAADNSTASSPVTVQTALLGVAVVVPITALASVATRKKKERS
jgi:hypothetical protein